MTDTRDYRRLHEIFTAVSELPRAQREAEIERRCGDDAALAQRVRDLLGFHEQEHGPLAEPIAPTAAPTAAGAVGGAGRPIGPGTTASTPLSEGPGTVIGRYKLLQPVGEGGFGVVYMAEQEEPVRRRVALKIIKLGMDTKQVIARFEAERQALALMEHPNIAKVLDAGATDTGRPYFVMELVKGEPITEYCDRNNLSTRERLALFTDVCRAVQHAHQKGVIHRDIKPSNVMVTLHDGVPVPKVIDFGIAKATSQRLTEKTLFTEYRQFIGTPEYMSPEQAEMSGLDIDTRSDIYSLGVLLYELLTGTTPFDAVRLREAGYGEIQRIIREEEPPRPSTRLSALSTRSSERPLSEVDAIARRRHTDATSLTRSLRGDLDWIVMTCLEKDRTRRYETANGLALDIGRYLSDEPVQASPPSRGYKIRKFVRRNRAGVLAAALVGAALVLGVIGTSSGLVWALSQKARAESAEEQAQRELTRANEVKSLITEMLGSVDPEEAQYADTTLLKEILDDTAARLKAGEIEDELVAAELHMRIGRVYRSLGLYEAAEEHTPVALEMTRRALGGEHPASLSCMTERAALFEARGQHARAEPLYLDVLETRRRLLGEEHPDTLASMSALAGLYRLQKRLEDAETLFRKTHEIHERELGAQHPETLGSLNGLAIVAWRRGRYPEAETLYVEILQAQKRTLGDEHSATLRTMVNLGLLYDFMGRYREAETLFRDALEGQRDLYGPEHPIAVSCEYNLANVIGRQGRYDDAEPLHRKILEIRERTLGKAHPETVWSLNALAMSLFEQGRHADAEPLLEEAVQFMRDLLGREHPDTLMGQNQLALLYSAQGRHEKAEQLFLETVRLREEALGERHPATLGTITNLGNLYNAMERYEDAARMFETSLPAKRDVLTTQHPWTRSAMHGLATAYLGLDRREDALALHRELLELKVAPADEPEADADTIRWAAWHLLTSELQELWQPPRALELAERAYGMAVEDGEPNLVAYLDTLALAQFRSADFPAAVETGRRALELAPDDAHIRNRLAAYEAALTRARQMMSDLVARRIAAAEAPGAEPSTIDETAWLLLTAFLEEFRDPRRALALAERASALEQQAGGDALWVYLVTLALAQHRTGDTASATETRRRAVELTPEAADPEILERLAEAEREIEAAPRTRSD